MLTRPPLRSIGLLLFGVCLTCAAPGTCATDAPFDYFQNSWNVIGLKDYNDGTRITPANELLLAHKTKAVISCGSSE